MIKSPVTSTLNSTHSKGMTMSTTFSLSHTITPTHKIQSSFTAQRTGKLIVNLRPGHILADTDVSGGTVEEVAASSTGIVATLKDGTELRFNHDCEIEVLTATPTRPDGLGQWDGCPSCRNCGPAHRPRNKACRERGIAHCTCSSCF